jgi:adenosine kinase
MASIICGSLAFDTIMNFEGRFSEQILPEQLHILNVSFLVPALRRDFGGCAGNIAYALKQLGGNPLPMAAIGRDGGSYLERFKAQGIATEFVRTIEDAYTAQAMIITDADNNQINGFHPGAMDYAHLTTVTIRDDIKLGIVAPDGRNAMLQHADQFAAARIPFVFDPGQQLPRFDNDELRAFVDQASWVTVNDYEGKMLSDRTGWDSAEISRRVQGLIVTLGAEGSEVWIDGEKTRIPPVHPATLADPTGCGDAFRGALLFGLEQGWPLARCASLGNQLGSIKIAQHGPQNYSVDLKKLGLS